MSLNIHQLIAKLHKKGYKVTPQRLAVFEFITSREDHPTADQIHKEVKKKYPTMSLATVYQALHLLTEVGLVQELGFNDKGSRYDPNIMPHINIVCLNCGKIYDYEAESVKEMWSKIVAELRFKPVGQRLDIYRYCDGCSDEKDSTF
jgi:Fur family transcriptional regulator, peroxide stress response regulator